MSEIRGAALRTLMLAIVAFGLFASPAAGANVWSRFEPIDNVPDSPTSGSVDSIDCPSSTLCLANGGALASTDPTGGYAAWKSEGGGMGVQLSCPATNFCVGVNGDYVSSSTDPLGGPGAWTNRLLPAAANLQAVSCPSTSLCVAADGLGGIATSTDPTNGGWTLTPIPGAGNLQSISCPTTTLCVAIDTTDQVVTSTDPTGGSGAWTVTTTAGPGRLARVSCASVSLCVATDMNGYVLASSAPTAGASAWTVSQVDAPNTELFGISCIQSIVLGIPVPGSALCVAVDGQHVVTSTNPTGGASAWTVTPVTGAITLSSVSCASSSLCVAGDYEFGNVAASTNPTGGSSAWTLSQVADFNHLSGISCPSTNLCAAGDGQGNILTTSTPDDPTQHGWSGTRVDPHLALTGISCATASLCVAVDDSGNAAASSTPTVSNSWSVFPIDTSPLTAVSCTAPSLCVAVGAGDVTSSTSPTAGSSAWQHTTVASGKQLYGVTCPDASLCVAVGASGLLETTTDPTGPADAWTGATIDTSDLKAVSCPSVSMCVAIDAAGNELVSLDPTGGPSKWQKTAVDPEPLTSVACPTTSLCAATDSEDAADIIANPASSPQTTTSEVNGLATAVSCPSASLCVAVDTDGKAGLADIPPAPTHTAPPSIAGSAQQGQPLTATAGQWTGSPTTFNYQWQRCEPDGSSCAPINGGNGQIYIATGDDVGHTLRVSQTAINIAGSATATSNPTAVVLPEPPANIAPPTISGDLVEGQTLTEQHGAWTSSPTRYSYQWLRCDPSGKPCTAIKGATRQTYTLGAADVGQRIGVEETASNPGGSSSPASSARTSTIEAPSIERAPMVQSPPVVSGSPAVGQTLSSTTGTWTGTPPLNYAYQWQLCSHSCNDIKGANRPRLHVTANFKGMRLRLIVSATNSVGTRMAHTDKTAPVEPSPLSSAKIRKLLRAVAFPHGNATRTGRLLARSGIALRFTAPRAGLLSITWYRPNVSASTVELATGSRQFASAGTRFIHIELTTAGKRLLRHASRTTDVVVDARFIEANGQETALTGTLRLHP